MAPTRRCAPALAKRADIPLLLGRDFSGVVSAVGQGVTTSRSATPCSPSRRGQEGAYAEKIAIKAAIVAKKPASISHVEPPRWRSPA